MRFIRNLQWTVVILIVLFSLSETSFADSAHTNSKFQTIRTARFTLHYQTDRQSESRQREAGVLASKALELLDGIDRELTSILNYNPQEQVILRFMSRADFKQQTGAPEWTNAMFYRGEITIPIDDKGLDFDELYRALRHEYLHALVADLSRYRCPAWLDEGLAQIIEGEPNPLLGPALRKWISRNDAMPLEWLQNGFTSLSNSIVPAAYAQSLFATRTLVNQRGFLGIKMYLRELREGKTHDVAFRRAFGFTEKEFEQRLTKQIAMWASSNQLQP